MDKKLEYYTRMVGCITDVGEIAPVALQLTGPDAFRSEAGRQRLVWVRQKALELWANAQGLLTELDLERVRVERELHERSGGEET